MGSSVDTRKSLYTCNPKAHAPPSNCVVGIQLSGDEHAKLFKVYPAATIIIKVVHELLDLRNRGLLAKPREEPRQLVETNGASMVDVRELKHLAEFQNLSLGQGSSIPIAKLCVKLGVRPYACPIAP